MARLLAVAALLVLGAAAIYGLHRLALWAEERGFIFYLRRRASRTTLGNAFLQMQSLLEPGQRRVVGERTRVEEDEDGAGSPPPTDRPD